MENKCRIKFSLDKSITGVENKFSPSNVKKNFPCERWAQGKMDRGNSNWKSKTNKISILYTEYSKINSLWMIIFYHRKEKKTGDVNFSILYKRRWLIKRNVWNFVVLCEFHWKHYYQNEIMEREFEKLYSYVNYSLYVRNYNLNFNFNFSLKVIWIYRVKLGFIKIFNCKQ